MAYTGLRVELLETPVFTRQIMALLSDEEYRRFQSQLAANPAIGSLIKGGGCIRKARLGVGSRGKSGGAPRYHYWASRKNLILLLYAYPKNATANLTPKQTTQLAKFVKEEFGNEIQDV